MLKSGTVPQQQWAGEEGSRHDNIELYPQAVHSSKGMPFVLCLNLRTLLIWLLN